MRHFTEIEELAIRNKGGEAALKQLLDSPLGGEEIRAIPGHRWLSAMTKCVFQAGFNWQLIEDKWSRFEEVFEGFDVARWSMMNDDDLDALLNAGGIVANGAKIKSVGTNAVLLRELEQEHGSPGAFFASWDKSSHCDLLMLLAKRGGRLGGRSGQIFLRRLGVDTLIFSPDVLVALKREGVVDKMPTSARGFAAVQAAIDTWIGQTPRPLTQISQILAFSVI